MLKIKISHGPSREELFDALRLSTDEKTVMFTVEEEGAKSFAVPMQILGIASHYDYVGDLWNISLRLRKPFSAPFLKDDSEYYQDYCEYGILMATYSTKTRKGIFTGITELPYRPVYSEKKFTLSPTGISKGLIKDALFSRVTLHLKKSVWKKRVPSSASPGTDVNIYEMVAKIDVDGLFSTLDMEKSPYYQNLEKVVLSEAQIRQFVEKYGKDMSYKVTTYFLLKIDCRQKTDRHEVLYVGIRANGSLKGTFSVDIYDSPSGMINPHMKWMPFKPDKFNFVVQKVFQ